MKKNDSIQILRAVAALLVVYIHCIFIVQYHGIARQSSFFNIASFGACGVDIFFAISGFLLSSVALNIRPAQPRAAIDFLIRRFIRIFPIYWILSLFFVLVLIKQRHLTLSWFIDSYLLLPSLRFPMPTPLIFVGWTLIFEMFFYYVITFNLFFGRRRVVERTMVTIVGLIALGAIVGFQRPVLILLANPMNVEFVFGCVIGLVYAKTGKRQMLGNGLLIAGTLLLVSTIFLGSPEIGEARNVLDGTIGWRRVVIWGIPAAMITAGLAFRLTPIRSSFGRFCVRLGDASYSIYLISLIVFYVYQRFYPALIPDINIALSFVVVVVCGVLCHRLLERPVTRMLTAKYDLARHSSLATESIKEGSLGR
jgi:exopolysaccharide production protein ExoZ